MQGSVERRLATILAADVAGFTRLMRADEEETLRALTACRTAVDELICRHGGRIANTAGDSLLAEFPSVAEGFSCALAIQRLNAARNLDISANRRMLLRIGLHLGDVMVRSGDLFGDAVNIAARLQSLAHPGGICLSSDARKELGPGTPTAITDAGRRHVKNIAEPVQVFRVEPAGVLTAEGSNYVAAADKPSIAVLPLLNLSSDPEQEFLGDGISDDVITTLSRYPSLFVIARNSSFTYKNRARDIKEIGRDLGVRYVLEGSLRKAGNRIRLSAQLVEAETGKHVWADRYDGDLTDIFATQDTITEAVTTAIAPAIADAERQRAIRKPPENIDAWAAYQRGMWHMGKANATDYSIAEGWFQNAIELDDHFSGGYRGLAYAQLVGASIFQLRPLSDVQDSAEALARQAIALDSNDAEARALLSQALSYQGDEEGSLAEANRALTICPNLAFAHGRRGVALVFSGRVREGIEALRTGIRLDPYDATVPLRWTQIVCGLYFCGDYEAALSEARQLRREYPEIPNAYRWIAAALGQLGRTAEAREALTAAIAVSPTSFDLYVRNRVPWMRPEDYAHMLDGLRKAGWHG